MSHPANGDIRPRGRGHPGRMIGRGCFGNPWLFQQAQAALEGRPSRPCRRCVARWDTAVRQIQLAVEDKGEHIALLRHAAAVLDSREHANYYKEWIVRERREQP